jgi:hypothetical protein
LALLQKQGWLNVDLLDAKILNSTLCVGVLGMPNAWLGKYRQTLRAQNSRHLAKCVRNVRNVMDCVEANHPVEGPSRQRKRLCVTGHNSRRSRLRQSLATDL